MFPMTSSFVMSSCRNSRNLLLYFKCKSSPFVKDFSRLQKKLGSKTPPTQRHLISPRNNGRSSDPLCFDFVSYSWLSKTRLGSGVRPRLSYRMITKRLPICLPNTRPEKSIDKNWFHSSSVQQGATKAIKMWYFVHHSRDRCPVFVLCYTQTNMLSV